MGALLDTSRLQVGTADADLLGVISSATAARRRRPRAAAALAVAGMFASACSFGTQFEERSMAASEVTISVVDELGDPVEGADVLIGETTTQTDDDGAATIEIDAPVVAVISTDGMLDEPVAIGPTDVNTQVRLWARTDADGAQRTSLHFGGDMMLGRRYLDPELPTPHVDDAESARRIVASLAPITATADWTSVNLETVVGNLPDEQALPAKRFLLQSTPLVTETLDEMGVDLVTLGNNHAYDWGEVGITSTLDILDAVGLDHVGAAATREDAVRGKMVDIDGLLLGVVSLTTVNGSFVNDQLPIASEPIPDDLDPAEAWQYERREFSYRSRNASIVVQSRPMRISEVWSIIETAESYNGFTEHAELWASARAVFPELQDWVARRGHGGAAPYQRAEMEEQIQRLNDAGAHMTVVQIHGGFQFAEVNSTFLRDVSRRAIDAGADAVVSHHPHVLQGVEWYNDSLIVYSLGNLVFDQNFASTFAGAVLRVVTDGDEVLEARLLPIMLDRYRPVPVVGESAEMIIRMVDARTASPALSERIDGLTVGSVLDTSGFPTNAVGFTPTEDSARDAAVVFERNSGIIVRERPTSTYVADFSRTELRPCAIARTDDLPPGTMIGTDLFDWGSFSADGARVDPPSRLLPFNWLVLRDDSRWNYTDGPSGEMYDRAIELFTDTDSTTSIRWSSRIDVDEHRLFNSAGDPIDGLATYEVVMDVRRIRGEQPSIRLVSFDFDDTDPTTDPETERLNEVRIDIPVADDGDWHRVVLPVPAEFFAPGPDGHAVNTAMLLIDAPPALRGQLAVDNVQFIEWRGTTQSPRATWVEADMIRSARAGTEVTLSGC